MQLQAIKAMAEQGDAEAQYDLGEMYYFGWGVPQDYKQAFKWYSRAAEQGQAGAQFSLGRMYCFVGQGVPQDYVLAHMWYDLAAAEPAFGEARDSMAKEMTPEQIAEAQKLAREWMEKHRKE